MKAKVTGVGGVDKKGKSQAVKALAQSILYDPRENKKNMNSLN